MEHGFILKNGAPAESKEIFTDTSSKFQLFLHINF